MSNDRTSSLKRHAGLLAVVGLVIGAGIITAGTAQAAPKGNPATVVCDNGHTYNITSPSGNGRFTPGFASDGTLLVPKAFGESTATETIDGVLSQTMTEPPSSQQAAVSNKNVTVNCTYTGGFSFTDADGHVHVITFSGTATLMLPGRPS